MKRVVMLVMILLLLSVCGCLGEDVTKLLRPAPNSATVPIEVANARVNVPVSSEYELSGTMKVVEKEVPSLFSVHIRVKGSNWLIEWEVLDPETKELIKKFAESYDGKYCSFYAETKTSRRLQINQVEIQTWDYGKGRPSKPQSYFIMQEFEILLNGGITCMTFDYFAGSGEIAGVKDCDCFVGVGETGWTAAFFDTKDGYLKEYWDGANDRPGWVKTIRSGWIKGPDGVWRANILHDEMRPQSQKTLKTVDIEQTKFSTTVLKDVFTITQIPGTLVILDNDYQYLAGQDMNPPVE